MSLVALVWGALFAAAVLCCAGVFIIARRRKVRGSPMLGAIVLVGLHPFLWKETPVIMGFADDRFVQAALFTLLMLGLVGWVGTRSPRD